MINISAITRYRRQDFLQFIRNTLMIVEQHNADELHIQAQYRTLADTYQQLLRGYQRSAESDTASQLTRLDARRDRALICLRLRSESYLHHHEEALQTAGAQVLAAIDQYGSRIYHLNYGAETATLKKLLRDLETDPEVVRALEVLGVADTVREMKRANQEFERVFIRRLGENSQTKLPAARELVRQTAEAYRTLVKYAEAHAILNPSEAYRTFIGHLNENIAHFNQLAERRKSPEPPSDKV